MKLPIKYSTEQKLIALSLKSKDRSLPFSERSQAEDQYEALASKQYAKGGVIKKETIMATKKMSEYGGKEMYASKAAMMKHEKKEPMKMEKKEAMMAKGGMTKKPVLAIMIGVGKPKKEMAKGGMAKKK